MTKQLICYDCGNMYEEGEGYPVSGGGELLCSCSGILFEVREQPRKRVYAFIGEAKATQQPLF